MKDPHPCCFASVVPATVLLHQLRSPLSAHRPPPCTALFEVRHRGATRHLFNARWIERSQALMEMVGAPLAPTISKNPDKPTC